MIHSYQRIFGISRYFASTSVFVRNGWTLDHFKFLFLPLHKKGTAVEENLIKSKLNSFLRFIPRSFLQLKSNLDIRNGWFACKAHAKFLFANLSCSSKYLSFMQKRWVFLLSGGKLIRITASTFPKYISYFRLTFWQTWTNRPQRQVQVRPRCHPSPCPCSQVLSSENLKVRRQKAKIRTPLRPLPFRGCYYQRLKKQHQHRRRQHTLQLQMFRRPNKHRTMGPRPPQGQT